MASTEALDVEAGGGGGGGVNLPPEPEDKGALKPIAETTPLERVFGIVAGGALATSLAAIIIEQSAIVIVAGILSCVMVRDDYAISCLLKLNWGPSHAMCLISLAGPLCLLATDSIDGYCSSKRDTRSDSGRS